MSPSDSAPRRCTALTNAGKPCRAYAMHHTDPPLCAIHAGRARGGGTPGNRNAVTHGFYATFDLDNPEHPAINGIIEDLAARQAQLAGLINQYLDQVNGFPLKDLVNLLRLHGQNASRLGRLLRDRRALSGEAADGLNAAIAQALDELGTEWGWDL